MLFTGAAKRIGNHHVGTVLANGFDMPCPSDHTSRPLPSQVPFSPERSHCVGERVDRPFPADDPGVFADRFMSFLTSCGIPAAGVFHYTETDSTNMRAHALARQGSPEGTIVIADSQTAGRGQFGRSWHSPPGKGIYLSVILRPKIPPMRMLGATLMSAVCLADVLKGLCRIDAAIKWPNDLLVRGRKISGILTEMSSKGGVLDYFIVGVGINLAHTREDFPPEIRDKATSVLLETGSVCDRTNLVTAFLRVFHLSYREYLENGPASFADRWNTLSATNGKRVRIRHAGTHNEGIFMGIDDNGAVLIRGDDGLIRRLDHAGMLTP